MKKVVFFIFSLVIFPVGVFTFFLDESSLRESKATTGLPVEEVPSDVDTSRFSDWKRPEGPPRVGLQVGHLRSSEAPEELKKIRGNTGARAREGMSESDVAQTIIDEAAAILREKGVVVDILPATIPHDYTADAFVAVHADDHTDSSKSGYKFSGPRRDYTGKTEGLVRLLEEKYEEATGLEKDSNITRNMRGYYAFAWWRYEHAIHPMTPGAIAETGFMSNDGDLRLLIDTPEIPGRAIAEALIDFLTGQGLL